MFYTEMITHLGGISYIVYYWSYYLKITVQYQCMSGLFFFGYICMKCFSFIKIWRQMVRFLLNFSLFSPDIA